MLRETAVKCAVLLLVTVCADRVACWYSVGTWWSPRPRFIPHLPARRLTKLCEQERMRYAQQCADYQPLTSVDWERCTSTASSATSSSMQEINAEDRYRATLRAEFRRENPHLFTPEVTQPTPSSDAVRPPPMSRRRSCCRVCRTGKACGNSCISHSYTCRRSPGCACNGNQLQLGPGAAAACDIGLPSPLLLSLSRRGSSWPGYGQETSKK